MSKIIIADVLYTNTDESFYVLDRVHENAETYHADTVEAVIQNLREDGWDTCGKVNKSDGSLADLLSNDKNDYIAVWEE